MADQFFPNTPWGDITIKDEWPEWLKIQWLTALGQPAPIFVPTFRDEKGSDGTQTWSLNPDYFATMETAQAMADKYGDGTVTEFPFGGTGGMFTASANEYHIKLADGRYFNAGLIAAFYRRNPGDLFPGVADQLIRAALHPLGTGDGK